MLVVLFIYLFIISFLFIRSFNLSWQHGQQQHKCERKMAVGEGIRHYRWAIIGVSGVRYLYGNPMDTKQEWP